MSNIPSIKEAVFRIKNWLYNLMPDKLFLKIKFKKLMGYPLNLKKTITFSEKLQWLKLYDRKPEYTKMVDKYAVKEYVSKIIGQEYVIPTLGVWNRVDDIDWKGLPNSFVLKCTHDSGGVVICKDKSSFGREAAIKKLSHSYKNNYYKMWREWPYKNVPKKIIAEKYIDPTPNVKDLPDYKWYCFNGEPKFCQVIQNRSSDENIDFFDTDWEHQDFIGLNPKATNASVLPMRPVNLDTHIKIVRELSKDIPFARIDLYETGERTYFGEITFYPMSGFGKFQPEQYNEILGQMITLPDELRR